MLTQVEFLGFGMEYYGQHILAYKAFTPVFGAISFSHSATNLGTLDIQFLGLGT